MYIFGPHSVNTVTMLHCLSYLLVAQYVDFPAAPIASEGSTSCTLLDTWSGHLLIVDILPAYQSRTFGLSLIPASCLGCNVTVTSRTSTVVPVCSSCNFMPYTVSSIFMQCALCSCNFFISPKKYRLSLCLPCRNCHWKRPVRKACLSFIIMCSTAHYAEMAPPNGDALCLLQNPTAHQEVGVAKQFLVFACLWEHGWRLRCTHTLRSLTCVWVVACAARKLRPCPSYSRRRDRTTLKSILGEGKLTTMDHASHLASATSDDAELGMTFEVSLCMPNHIRALKMENPTMPFVKINKNTLTF